MSNFASVVQKRLGMYKFVRTKSHTGSKFSKIFFDHLYTGWIVVVHLCFGFSLWREMAPQQSAKFRTAFFGQFRSSLRKHSVANYASISTLFSLFVRAAYTRDNILQVCIVLRETMLLFLVWIWIDEDVVKLRLESCSKFLFLVTMWNDLLGLTELL